MAQTRRKRRSKHRGNAAGTIEARGRTGRPPTPEERKKQDQAKRSQARAPKPPTWNSAIKKALLATSFIFIFLLVSGRKDPVAVAIIGAIFAFALYVPGGYYTELWFYRRRQRKKLQGR